MGELNLHPPEHPRFPQRAEALQNPQRSPTVHEKRILEVFMRFKEVPDFDALRAPTPEELKEASERIGRIEAQAPDPVRDQDERVLDLLVLITDFREVFGKVGYFLAAEIMNAARGNIDTAEFRRAFFTEYEPMIPKVREYLREAANLRRRTLGLRYAKENVSERARGSAERRAAAKEQMELIQGMPDHYVMEKFWRTLEIVCSYPDFFTEEQYQQLVTRKGIEQAWRAHLAKARQDLTYYQSIIQTGKLFREMVDSALNVFRTVIKEREEGETPPSL